MNFSTDYTNFDDDKEICIKDYLDTSKQKEEAFIDFLATIINKSSIKKEGI